MTTIKAGDKAPEFSGIDQNGNTISSEALKGKKYVLYFYPKDNTPGCTNEAKNLRDNYKKLQKAGFEVIGVSPDSEKSHTKFIDKHELPFNLIADTQKEVLKAFELWGEKKMFGKIKIGVHRTTFVVDEAGVVMHVFKKVKTKEHAEQIFEIL
ncbi:MAG: thioredoxin-dependent thiol peroxidase [Bacteroidota bacterium]|nr:thioredoxin-dependent thiol peroxidase [Bacteroidota bacterium]